MEIAFGITTGYLAIVVFFLSILGSILYVAIGRKQRVLGGKSV